MVKMSVTELLEDYIKRGSETSFTELVNSHVNLVYSTALRRTGFDSHLAEDITQQVFADLAQKAATLPPLHYPTWLASSPHKLPRQSGNPR